MHKGMDAGMNKVSLVFVTGVLTSDPYGYTIIGMLLSWLLVSTDYHGCSGHTSILEGSFKSLI